MEKEQPTIKKLIREIHTLVYEIDDKFGRRTIQETQEIDIEDTNKNKFGFNYEDTSVQKIGKRNTENKQTSKTKKN